MDHKVVLIIFDGFGLSPQTKGNAIFAAQMPNYNFVLENYPKASLSASSEEVGLSWGIWGNSEIGHMNIGSGRVVWQDLPRIFNSIEDKSFFKNPNILKICKNAKNDSHSLHLIGLISDAGVHSHIEHLYALLKVAREQKIPRVFIHFIADGRDTSPKKAKLFLPELERQCKDSNAQIATVIGRYYAMDRDKRWPRVEKAYNAMVLGQGKLAKSPTEAIDVGYNQGQTDEFIDPTVIVDNNQKPIGTINDGDSVIFFNFRQDRARQLTQSLVSSNFSEFKRDKKVQVMMVTMTDYGVNDKNILFIFQPVNLINTLAEVISNQNLSQLHAAETEKYAHVTYFFNGGIEKPFPLEDRILVPSPKVATYDQKPEMSAGEIGEKIEKALNENKYSFVVINFANPDMVGHTGDFAAAVKGLEFLDKVFGNVIKTALTNQYQIMLTSDHGNIEQMVDPKNSTIDTEHSSNPVPFILISRHNKKSQPITDAEKLAFLMQPPLGVLADIAPSILEIMDIQKPDQMTGISLLNNLS
jgi:2,3-bisphosphoglycerate-independent phosphoglycerate mutase